MVLLAVIESRAAALHSGKADQHRLGHPSRRRRRAAQAGVAALRDHRHASLRHRPEPPPIPLQWSPAAATQMRRTAITTPPIAEMGGHRFVGGQNLLGADDFGKPAEQRRMMGRFHCSSSGRQTTDR
jgi:hypothetical protein